MVATRVRGGLCGKWRTQRGKRGFLEGIDRQDLVDFVQAQFALKLLFEDGRQQVHADGDPDLGLHRVVRVAVEGFDSQMLLDPFEEQFDLPTTAVELRDRERRQDEVVRQEPQLAAMLHVVETDATQRLRILPRDARSGQRDGLIGAQSGGFFDRAKPVAPTPGCAWRG